MRIWIYYLLFVKFYSTFRHYCPLVCLLLLILSSFVCSFVYFLATLPYLALFFLLRLTLKLVFLLLQPALSFFVSVFSLTLPFLFLCILCCLIRFPLTVILFSILTFQSCSFCFNCFKKLCSSYSEKEFHSKVNYPAL